MSNMKLLNKSVETDQNSSLNEEVSTFICNYPNY